MAKALITGYHHWQYFLALESDLINLSRYIEFRGVTQQHSKNAQVYSIELVRIFFAACAECEYIGKILAGIQSGDIYEISDEIILTSPIPIYGNKLPFQKIYCPVHDLTFTPWNKWDQLANPKRQHPTMPNRQVQPNPEWWIFHNLVKHYRSSKNYKKASLLNTLNAVSGLMCLLFWAMHTQKLDDKGNIDGYQLILPLGLAPKLFSPETQTTLMNINWVWVENI